MTSSQTYSIEHNTAKNGFTIVELLIVIVVIAILAAITIVAFNGIQQRASDTARQANLKQITQRLDGYGITNESFPESISDCPNPSAENLCLTSRIEEQVRYERITTNAYTNVNGWLVPGYAVGILGEQQFIYHVKTEQRGSNEFLRFADIAPYIDKYGLVPYQLSFDLKSENTSNRNTVNVYLQNGSNTRYTFGVPVTATTEYKNYTIEFTPTVSNLSVAQSYLAFYGTYSTGNVPIVKNVTLKKK